MGHKTIYLQFTTYNSYYKWQLNTFKKDRQVRNWGMKANHETKGWFSSYLHTELIK